MLKIVLSRKVLILLICLLPFTQALAEPEKARISTGLGDIVVELFADRAPVSVENFKQYVKDGFYDSTIFHRVIDSFMIQGGGYTADFQKKDTREPVENEANNGLKNNKYTIAMARTSAPHSATSQFFINTADNDFLNHTSMDMRGWGYAVFGRVIEGQEIVDKIGQTPTGSGGPFPRDVPLDMVTITSVTLLDADAADKPDSAANAAVEPGNPTSTQ
ncbi:MAG: peptidyl-prolyl cis-trans isomerase [Gammaproteobacteria bacterium]|nr:peptidyl-prolyl cis-trans isomerase [Gammaproteobacteria bacterium]